MNYPKSLQDLVEEFEKLPGVGKKTAERYAFSLLDRSTEDVNVFASSLIQMKQRIIYCISCGNLSENEKCSICADEKRNKKILCIVENSKTIMALEQISIFNGLYHVLGGLISPIDGVGPEDINIKKILSRIEEENIEEIILALKPSIEGETTSLYIKEILKDKKLKITRIAYGIPIGFDMDYVDSMTWQRAFEERNQIS